ncbi:MAG: hypothetical protein JWL90_4120 [Chthoniobacteraceae bacterium]|nr:hypothetical protein [Chthoniobacteraceae bacterium]
MESIDELRYATEFSPPTVGSKSDESDAGKLNVDATVFEATPVQFEVRNTGVTLEVDPAVVVEDGKLIQFAVAVQRVRLKGLTKSASKNQETGARLLWSSPNSRPQKQRQHCGCIMANGSSWPCTKPPPCPARLRFIY